jgi:dephospho-CoA kinase
MLRVGLTGGMGCGKSTVAAMMREMGCQVLDADAVARELVEPGQPALEEIVRVFGARMLRADGRLDRARLAAAVFQDASKLAQLNALLHPRVIARQEAWLCELARREPQGVAVVEAALLIEAGAYKTLDRLIVVRCRPEQQIARLLADSRRAVSRQDVEARIAAQMPLEEKLRVASDQIDNSGTAEQTREQVRTLVAKLKALAARPVAKEQSHEEQ